MEKNIEKLARIGKSTLRLKLKETLADLERCIKYLTDYPKENINLGSEVNKYNKIVKNFKDNYGVKFPDLQKKYEEMLPEIKKYIEVKD